MAKLTSGIVYQKRWRDISYTYISPWRYKVNGENHYYANNSRKPLRLCIKEAGQILIAPKGLVKWTN